MIRGYFELGKIIYLVYIFCLFHTGIDLIYYRSIMDAGNKEERKINPRETCNPLSYLFFLWTLPIFNRGFKRDLEVNDLYEPLKSHKSGRLAERIVRIWEQEEYKATQTNKKPNLRRVIIKCFGLDFLKLGFILFIIEIGLRTIQPLVLGKLIQYFRDETITKNEAYLYALGVIACSFFSVIPMHPYMLAILHIGMKLRVACCSLIYRKSLRLNKTALGQTTIGQVVNLLSNDVNRFDIAVLFIHYLWVGPLQTLVVTYFIYQEVGIASVIGVSVLLSFIPLQAWFGKKTSILRLKTAIRTDERVRLMNEIISGIQVIKMYAWEKPFASLVSDARRKEIKQVQYNCYIKGILSSFIMFTTRISIFVSILAYVLLGNYINAEKVFVLTSFYNILRQSMTVYFPLGIAQFAEANVSIKRLEKFMHYDETEINQKKSDKRLAKLEVNNKKKNYQSTAQTPTLINNVIDESETPLNAPSNFYEQVMSDSDKEVQDEVGDIGNSETRQLNGGIKNYIIIKDANAKWTTSQTENTLTNININITKNSLIAIIGPVGSGKSSLLQMILQELPLESGNLKINGTISYASQEPWLFAGSVRQNILFGLPLNRKRYREVVKRCQLERDFSLFPYGDKTIVGERGVSLSGGQRARINLARAVYREADIYLLDDPLSAVDAHVGKSLFENCVSSYLKDKIVILVTHQLQYLKEVDKLYLLNVNGSIEADGTYTELTSTGLDFTKLLQDSNTSSQTDSNVRTDMSESQEKDNQSIKLLRSRQNSVQSINSSIDDSKDQANEPVQEEEHRSKGNVDSYVYATYFKNGGGWCKVSIIFVLFIFAQIFASASDSFITYWVNIEETHSNATSLTSQILSSNSEASLFEDIPLKINETLTATGNDSSWPLSRDVCIYIYTIVSVGTIIMSLLRSFAFFRMCMKASMNLHNNMFKAITRAPMYFFNTNSSGRILNRFSKDMGAIDEQLPAAFIDTLQIGLQLVGIVVVVAMVNIWLLIPTFLISLLFWFLRIFYLSTSRSVKRLEGITRSPVFAHLNASLQGLTTIRAFKAEDILVKEFDKHQDLHSGAWYLFLATSRAFAIWLDFFCVIYITIVTLSFLVFDVTRYGGNVGLAITQSIAITGMFQWGMRQSTEMENQMTSVERVLEYSNINQEPPLESAPDKKPAKDWPQKGQIEFKNLYLRYSPIEPPVLKDLTFVIQPKEKIGIVGRTGAGKSSLIQALFRLTDLEGHIYIDSIETRSIGLHDLRSKLSIIPQEPVLFSGTMRKNLDPFDEYGDDVLWKALEDVDLKEAVMELPAGLNSTMSEGGSNFSVGQRQLVCLARAVIRTNKILILDEATANVDPQTDTFIQHTIREKFASCTVLTIAHRLYTVMDSNRVLVMDAGKVVEFDNPYMLLQDEDGVFKSMVKQTGKAMCEVLHKIAEQSYKKQQRTSSIST